MTQPSDAPRLEHPLVMIRPASPEEAWIVQSILLEAADWLLQLGHPLWLPSELEESDIRQHVAEGLYHLAFIGDEAAGTFRFDLEDPLFWPDAAPGEAAYVHRLAVRRSFAGGLVTTPIFAWARARTLALGRTYLRLDCDAARPRLRQLYESFGFRYHSDRRVGPFHVARFELRLDKEV